MPATPAPVGPDLLVTGGRLFVDGTVRDGDLLVRGGRIAAVGPEAAGQAPAGVPWLDARGGLVTAGFQDSHVHPVHGGESLLRCDLSGAVTAAEYLQRIAAYAAAHPDAAWIAGGGWAMEAFPGGVPTAQQLDAVVPDRPAYLTNRDLHGAWVNSRALAAAGIDEHTPDPAHGRIERDDAGRPVGMLQEAAAELVGALVPQPTDAEQDRALLLGQQRLLAWGITGWQDAIVGSFSGRPDLLPVYRRVAGDGRLRARVVGALWWDRSRGLEQVPELLERRERGRVGRFRATSVKIMQDGIAENFTAGMLEPYLDAHGCVSGNAGRSFVEPELLRAAVSELHRHGFQVHLHALGDRAVRESLDAIEAAQAAPGQDGRDLRHHLAHLQVVHPDDVPRFAALGAVANIQPLWARHEPQMDELTIPFLGPRRSAWQYPFGSLLRSGATLAAGSDWPVSTADVLAGVHTAVTRCAAGGGPAFLPEQALTLAEALTAYTAGSAFVNHDEQRAGTLDVGKDGDLTVLDRDLFALPADELHRARVAYTVVGGEVVYDAAAVQPTG